MSLAATLDKYKQNQLKIITPQLQTWLKTPEANGPLVPPQVWPTISTQLQAVPRVRSSSFSASSSGVCPRAQVLGFLAEEPYEEPDDGLQNIFNDGKWRHIRWQTAGLASGALDLIEVPLTWRNMRLKGSMDGQGTVPKDHPVAEWRNREFGFELKGVNSFAYQYVMRKKPPTIKERHMAQIQRYMLMSGLDLFVAIYESKNNDWHEWVIEANDKLMDESLREVITLNHAIDTEELPPVKPSCLLAMGDDWKNCPYAGATVGTGPCMDWYKNGDPSEPFKVSVATW